MTYLILNSPDGVHSRKLVQTKEISHGSFPMHRKCNLKARKKEPVHCKTKRTRLCCLQMPHFNESSMLCCSTFAEHLPMLLHRSSDLERNASLHPLLWLSPPLPAPSTPGNRLRRSWPKGIARRAARIACCRCAATSCTAASLGRSAALAHTFSPEERGSLASQMRIATVDPPRWATHRAFHVAMRHEYAGAPPAMSLHTF
mmetsp:Transcript_22463/g.55859  ORF Transcript_22463/g.55859 Transcript_22463/m.55859 type:complete len:201 (-) Transcript_22463:284-886(-)